MILSSLVSVGKSLNTMSVFCCPMENMTIYAFRHRIQLRREWRSMEPPPVLSLAWKTLTVKLKLVEKGNHECSGDPDGMPRGYEWKKRTVWSTNCVHLFSILSPSKWKWCPEYLSVESSCGSGTTHFIGFIQKEGWWFINSFEKPALWSVFVNCLIFRFRWYIDAVDSKFVSDLESTISRMIRE